MYKLISSLKNSLSRRPALRRYVLFATVPATAFVAVAVALSLPARPDTVQVAQKFRVLATVPLQSNAQNSVAVNQALNKIYTSGGPSNSNHHVTVIDGTFPQPTPTPTPWDVGNGSNVTVDNKTNRYWATTVYDGSVIVRDGTSNAVIATVPIPPTGVCPIDLTYDFKYNRVWVGAQCGGFNDPVIPIDATTFQVITPPGPIGLGCVMGAVGANGVNGRLYENQSDGSHCQLITLRVDPITFAHTTTAFGFVQAFNPVTNKLYAVPAGTRNLQIINGAPDPEVILKTITLPYDPGNMAVNPALNALYIANPAGNSLEVRDPDTGALINIFSPLPATPSGPVAVDSIRGRIYVIDQSSSPPRLLVIEGLTTAYQPDCILSH